MLPRNYTGLGHHPFQALPYELDGVQMRTVRQQEHQVYVKILCRGDSGFGTVGQEVVYGHMIIGWSPLASLMLSKQAHTSSDLDFGGNSIEDTPFTA